MMASVLYGFKENLPGIERVWKSKGMQDALRSTLEPVAARANSNFALGRCDIPAEYGTKDGKTFHYGGTPPEIDPYGFFVDVAEHTAIGKVVSMTVLGRYDNSLNNTILKSR